MKFGVIVFPGSNCDADVYHVIENVLGEPGEYIWHEETSVQGFDCLVLPGGFSYGDYLRAGAIARFSPIVKAVIDFAASGGLVLGICNGFQILLEAGLLPGAMQPNKGLSFLCHHVWLRVGTDNSPFTSGFARGQVVRMPIAHFEGNYYADEATLKRLIEEDRIAFQYCTEEGEVTEEANPNGSRLNIAGVLSEGRNVLGMMPHPERCSERLLGGTDGLALFRSIVTWLRGG